MNRLTLAGVAAVALAAVPALAQHADKGGHGQPLTRAAVEARVAARFAQADTDRDGFITRAEVEAQGAQARDQRQAHRGERRARTFARLDANGDGSISRAEFDARPARDGAGRRRHRAGHGAARHQGRGMMAGFGIRRFEAMDADKDGRVSRAEASASALAMFERGDANRDGTVTAEERRAAREALRARRGG